MIPEEKIIYHLKELYPLYELFKMELNDVGVSNPQIEPYIEKLNEFNLSSNYSNYPNIREIIIKAFNQRILKIKAISDIRDYQI